MMEISTAMITATTLVSMDVLKVPLRSRRWSRTFQISNNTTIKVQNVVNRPA